MDNRTKTVIIIVSFVIITSFAGAGVGILLLIILGFIGYSNSSKNSKKVTEAKFHGSVFVQSMKASNVHNSCMARFEPPNVRTIDDFNKVFPAEMRAAKKEDANLTIYMIWFAQPTGSYSPGNTACQVGCQVNVYSREDDNNIYENIFVGSQPPEKIYVYGGRNRCNFDNVCGTYPDEAIKNRLIEIRETIKRNSLSTNVVQQNGNNEQSESITM